MTKGGREEKQDVREGCSGSDGRWMMRTLTRAVAVEVASNGAPAQGG